jgi:hypothetical protein
MPHQLFLTADAWQRLPAMLADPLHARIAEGNRQALAAIAAMPRSRRLALPPRLDRPGEPFAWWERSCRLLLERRTVAWRLGDAAQLAEVLADVEELAARDDWTPHSPGGHALHADLKTGDLAYCCAFALDCLPLPPALRVALIGRLRRDCLEPYLEGVRSGNWWRRAEFNWGPALHGNCGLAALAIRDEEPALSATVLAAAREGVACALEGYRAGGGWVEGLMYHSTHLGHLTDFAAAHHRLTGDDLGVGALHAIAETLDGRMALRLPDGRPASFSGCTEHTIEWFQPQAWWWAQRLGRPEWTAFEDGVLKPWWDAHGLFHDVAAFWYRPAGAAVRAPAVPALVHLAGVDWLAWRGADAWLALRGGDNGGNRANRDLGTFILGWGDERFCTDPGWGVVDTVFHSCVTVRGQAQTEAVAPIVRKRCGPGWVYAVIDLGACHPGSLSHHFRHLLLLDERELLVVDDLLGRRGGRCGARFHLQTALPAEPRGDGWVLRGRREAHVVPDACTHARIDERGDAEAKRPYRTLSWAAACDLPRTLHCWRIAVDAPPSAVVRREGDLLRIERDGRRWRIELDALHGGPEA